MINQHDEKSSYPDECYTSQISQLGYLDWVFLPSETELSTVVLGQGVSQDLKDAFQDINII